MADWKPLFQSKSRNFPLHNKYQQRANRPNSLRLVLFDLHVFPMHIQTDITLDSSNFGNSFLLQKSTHFLELLVIQT